MLDGTCAALGVIALGVYQSASGRRDRPADRLAVLECLVWNCLLRGDGPVVVKRQCGPN